MILCHIVAASENNVIGLDGQMPWHLPEDLKHFKKLTSGHAVIMGRKTYESIGKPLPNRLNIVISRTPQKSTNDFVVYVGSAQEALDVCERHKSKWGEIAFIIGGGEIYKQTLPMVKKVFLTRIHKTMAGDTSYPILSSSEFKLIEQSDHFGDPPYSFLEYERN
jgi:dihydrofolate reductase